MSEIKQNGMPSVNNCGICAAPLVYATESISRTCALCGKEEKTNIYCPDGHYVCNTCHSKATLDVLKEILADSTSSDPEEIMERIFNHPAVPLHGPDHHVIVPAVIVTAVRNSGYPLADGSIEKAIERATKVPGGWCGLYGDCGAAVGSGIAISVITGATPLIGKLRTMAMAATSQALADMLDEQPGCCKKASRIAVKSTVNFLRANLGINLPLKTNIRCAFSQRNQNCVREKCPYFDGES